LCAKHSCIVVIKWTIKKKFRYCASCCSLPIEGLSVATNACLVTRSLKLSNVEPGWYLGGWPPGKTERYEPVSVRLCGPKSVSDGPYSRYLADTDVNQSINQSVIANSEYSFTFWWNSACCGVARTVVLSRNLTATIHCYWQGDKETRICYMQFSYQVDVIVIYFYDLWTSSH